MNQFWTSEKKTRLDSFLFSTFCIIAAFGTYFCMYAFRKPFTAATYEGEIWLGTGLKTIFIAAQVAGYTCSKFLGIKFVSEMPPRYRAVAILVLVGIAEVALLLFAITPSPWNFIWLFVNGLPLGMVFGLVIGFLEGRKLTEALTAGLCASFILASGVVKSVGRSLIEESNVDQYWMPFWTGFRFIIPLFLFVWMLSKIPPPTQEDEALRSRRLPMNKQHRQAFFKRHRVGLICLLCVYCLLTIVRSIRDDFAVEIWTELGVEGKPAVFTTSEFWVMIGVVLINGFAILIRNNRFAFMTTLGLLSVGFMIVLKAVIGYQTGLISPMVFMVLLGLGMYIPYVAFHTTVFERMLAVFRETGNIGYLLYLADAVGYLGYIGVMVLGNTSAGEIDFLDLLIWTSVVVSLASTLITGGLLVYYHRTIANDNHAEAEPLGNQEN